MNFNQIYSVDECNKFTTNDILREIKCFSKNQAGDSGIFFMTCFFSK